MIIFPSEIMVQRRREERILHIKQYLVKGYRDISWQPNANHQLYFYLNLGNVENKGREKTMSRKGKSYEEKE